MELERNCSFDVLKLILSFVIVCHHTSTPLHGILLPLTNCAVPLYFMISGYFIFSKPVETGKLLKNAKRILKIFVFSELFYLLVYSYTLWGNFDKPEFPVLSLKDLIYLLLFNVEPAAGHLWYLLAYAYVLLALSVYTCYIRDRLKLCKITVARFFKFKPDVNGGGWIFTMTCVTAFLLLIYFAVSTTWIVLGYPKNLTAIYTFRNWLFEAIPLVLLGGIIRRLYVPRNKHWIWTFVLIFLAVLEYVILWFVHRVHVADIFYCTIPLSIAILNHFRQIQINNGMLAKIGKQYSLYIYIFHHMFVVLITPSLFDNNPTVFQQCISPFLSFVFALIVSVVYIKFKKSFLSIIA